MGKLGIPFTVASRINRLPLLPMHRKLVIVLTLGAFFVLYTIFVGGLLGAALTPLFHLNATQTALFISSTFIGMFLGTFLLNIVSRIVDRRNLYFITVLLYSLSSIATAFFVNYLWIVFFRFLTGLGLGAMVSLTDIYMDEMLPKYARIRYATWVDMFSLLGVPAAGLVAHLLLGANFFHLMGWRFLLIFGALGAPTIWFLRKRLPASPRWYEMRQKHDQANALLNQIEREAMLEHELVELPPPEELFFDPPPQAPSSTRDNQSKARQRYMFGMCQIVQIVSYYGFGTLIPYILVQKGLHIGDVLTCSTLIFIGYPLGTALSIPLVEYCERKWLIVVSLCVMGACGVVFGFSTFIAWSIATGATFSTASNLFSHTLRTYQAEIVSTSLRGGSKSPFYVGQLTNVGLPFIALPMLQSWSAPVIFISAAFILGIVGLDVSLLGPRTKRQRLKLVTH
jgi:putative MFS transporter